MKFALYDVLVKRDAFATQDTASAARNTSLKRIDVNGFHLAKDNAEFNSLKQL